jgi:16S rRNA G966 N2-methylase RsmD
VAPAHDRAYLLSDQKRNDVLSLLEVERYGRDSFGDSDYVSVYAMRPRDWYARGVRLLARTAVECTRDRLADLIGRDVAELVQAAPAVPGSVVVDPFAGSCNTLFWIKRHVGARACVGFEVDDGVFETTRTNLALLDADIELLHLDYESALSSITVADHDLLIVFVAPPWGDALSQGSLDLRRTRPPVTDVIDLVATTFPRQRILFATQVYENVVPATLADVTSRCDWSALEIYDVNARGQNHGVLFTTRGWTP